MFWNKKELVFYSPVKGKLIPLSEVPDEAFAQNKFGYGFAILPEENTIISPTDGKVMFAFETKHAISIKSDSGAEYLIHVGINTYKLKGQNFECFVTAEQKIKKGELLLKFDLDFIKQNDLSTITPIVFTNIEPTQIEQLNFDYINQGQEIFRTKKF